MKPRKSRKLRKLGKSRKRVKKGGTRHLTGIEKVLARQHDARVAEDLLEEDRQYAEWQPAQEIVAKQKATENAIDSEEWRGHVEAAVMRAQQMRVKFQEALDLAKEKGIDVENLVKKSPGTIPRADWKLIDGWSQYEVDGWDWPGKRKHGANIINLINKELKERENSPPPSPPSQSS